MSSKKFEKKIEKKIFPIFFFKKLIFSQPIFFFCSKKFNNPPEFITKMQ